MDFIENPTRDGLDTYLISILDHTEKRNMTYVKYHKAKDWFDNEVNALIQDGMPRTKAEAKVQQEQPKNYTKMRTHYANRNAMERANKAMRAVFYHTRDKLGLDTRIDVEASRRGQEQ